MSINAASPASMQPFVHTPGPWRTARGFATSPPIVLPMLVVCGQGKDCRTLAIVTPSSVETDEDIANAALMSRSPKMFKLLHEAANILSGCRGNDAKELVSKIQDLIVDIRGSDE